MLTFFVVGTVKITIVRMDQRRKSSPLEMKIAAAERRKKLSPLALAQKCICAVHKQDWKRMQDQACMTWLLLSIVAVVRLHC